MANRERRLLWAVLALGAMTAIIAWVLVVVEVVT